MKRLNKRYMTLLELLIALGLTVMVLTTLTYFYRQVDMVDRKIEKIQQESFEMRFIENRLAKVLPAIVSPRNEKKDYFLMTDRDNGDGMFKRDSKTLLFTFDNGVDLDKNFSNHVLGRLFIDQNNNLILAVWPSPKRWESSEVLPMQKEVLMQGVEQIDFSFYVPPERKRSQLLKNALRKPGNMMTAQLESHDTWIDQWQYEYFQLPAMMRVTVRKSGAEKPFVFAFPLVNSEQFIVYEK